MALPWSEPSWLQQVTTWIGRHADITGPIQEMHRRPWSAMLRVPTGQCSLYFKATAPSMAYEAALTRALATWRPECTVDLVAIDPDQGWLLMADAGPTLRSELIRGPSAYPLEGLFQRYGELQVATVNRTDEILRLGVPDRRLANVERQGAELGVDLALLRRLVVQVEQLPIPDTLAHEEVHDANVLLRDGTEVFIDWSDSSVAHPFFGVVVALRSLSDRLDVEPGDARLESCVDAYLAPWTAVASLAELRSVFPAAYRLGMLNRALSWHAGSVDVDPPTRQENAEYAGAWLEEFLQAADPKPGT